MITTANLLNLRSGPGDMYPVVAILSKGSEVTRLFVTPTMPDGRYWSFITWGKLHGFVASQYLAESPVKIDPATGRWIPRREDPHWMTPRAGWGAKAGRGAYTENNLKLVVVHHEKEDPTADFTVDSTPDQEKQRMRSIEAFHASPKPTGRGWSGFAYNFCIFPSGRVYQGRGWGHMGAHSDGENARSVGVLFPQDGNRQDLTPQQIESFRLLMQEGVDRRALAPEWKADGHRNMPGESTMCPGSKILARIPELNRR